MALVTIRIGALLLLPILCRATEDLLRRANADFAATIPPPTPPGQPIPDRGWILMIVLWIFFPLAVLTTAMRFFLRTRRSKLGYSDYFILLANVYTPPILINK